VARASKWIVAVAGVVMLPFAGGFVLFAHHVARFTPVSNQLADAIVVLTGGDRRLAAGAKLLRDGRGAKLLISGVNRQTSVEDLKRISGLSDRLFECCVDIDYAAHSTSDNADQTRAWAERRRLKRLIVVTSSYHMPRSLTELRRALPEVALVPHPVVSSKFQPERWWADIYTARLLLSEYVKFLPAAARYGAALLLRWEDSAFAGGKPNASSQ
jgi:uncharacterized SAM-binding protein YcdF (DUF218 family)